MIREREKEAGIGGQNSTNEVCGVERKKHVCWRSREMQFCVAEHSRKMRVTRG